MRVALGMKAHSGWAVLVVVGGRGGETRVVDRRRVELVEEGWAKQPYHAAEHLDRRSRPACLRGVACVRALPEAGARGHGPPIPPSGGPPIVIVPPSYVVVMGRKIVTDAV
jgi:hypothetical protein